MFREFDRIIEEAFKSPMRTRSTSYRGVADTPSIDPRKFDGYRKEVVNGEEHEYVYIDGEWKELPLDESNGAVRVDETSVTIDLSEYGVPTDFEAVGEVSFNNGVLEVTFESGDTE